MEVGYMKALRIALAALFILSAASCSLKQSWDLAGKWQRVDSDEIIEFLPNGTLFNLVRGKTNITASYRFPDAQHIEIDLAGLGHITVAFEVTTDTLTLTDSKGVATKYKKIK